APSGESSNLVVMLAGVDSQDFQLDLPGLSRSQFTQEPGNGSCREVMAAPVTGIEELESGRHHVTHRDVGGRGITRIGHLEGVSRLALQVTELGTGNFNFDDGGDDVDAGLVL